MNLLPLEVPPGWPQPEPLSDFVLLMLTVVGPLAFAAVVTLLVFAPKLVGRSRDVAPGSTEVVTAD